MLVGVSIWSGSAPRCSFCGPRGQGGMDSGGELCGDWGHSMAAAVHPAVPWVCAPGGAAKSGCAKACKTRAFLATLDSLAPSLFFSGGHIDSRMRAYPRSEGCHGWRQHRTCVLPRTLYHQECAYYCAGTSNLRPAFGASWGIPVLHDHEWKSAR